MGTANTTTADLGIRAQQVQRTRRRLSVEGLRLITEQGFANTTVDQIAAAAGVSQRTFFRHYPCKEALLHGDYDHDEVLDRLEFPPEGETLGESLRHIAMAWERLGDAHDKRRRNLRYALQTEHPSILNHLDEIMRGLEPRIIGAVARRLRVYPDTDLRPLVVAQMYGALAKLVIQRPPDDPTDFLDQWFEAAAGVLNRTGEPRASTPGAP